MSYVGTTDKYFKAQTWFSNDQPDAQFLYFIIRILQSSTCFEHNIAQNM